MRTGNGAAHQHQLDGYGWVLDAAWVLVDGGHPLYSETWRAMRGFTDLVARRWQEPDAGIWEIRADVAQHGSSDLDAALLVLPVIGLEEARSDRVKGTVDAIREELSAGPGLLYRYPPGRDGLPGSEGAFLPCSFWLVQALTHAALVQAALALRDAPAS